MERKIFFGLADSIIDGVKKIIKDYGHVIVLGDDLVTSQDKKATSITKFK